MLAGKNGKSSVGKSRMSSCLSILARVAGNP